jgi:prolycopene isomerase
VLPPQIGLAGLDEVARNFPTLIKYLRSTVAEVLDEYLGDPRPKGACGAMWPYMGLPPSRLSFVTYATTVSVYLDGGFYCEGSFQRLADAFAAGVRLHGGEIVTQKLVTGITVEDGRAAGIELADGERVRAGIVVSNADARRTFDELVGEEHLPARFLRRLHSMVPSLSAVVLFAATDMDLAGLGLGHEIFHPQSYDQDESYAEIQAGRPGGMWASIPTMLDPSLAPAGEHVLTMTSLARFDIGRPWPEAIDAFSEKMLDAFEVVFPGLRGSLTHLRSATPLTMERFCLNSGGAAYAWENTPDQTGGKRSPHVTPVEGLFLVGHWTQPGSGSLRAIVSGLHAAHLVLLATDSGGLEFEHRDMPPAS